MFCNRGGPFCFHDDPSLGAPCPPPGVAWEEFLAFARSKGNFTDDDGDNELLLAIGERCHIPNNTRTASTSTSGETTMYSRSLESFSTSVTTPVTLSDATTFSRSVEPFSTSLTTPVTSSDTSRLQTAASTEARTALAVGLSIGLIVLALLATLIVIAWWKRRRMKDDQEVPLQLTKKRAAGGSNLTTPSPVCDVKTPKANIKETANDFSDATFDNVH